MIIKGRDVIGLNVVTVDTGTVIETVDDIAYDPSTHRIVALLVDSGGLFSSAKAIHMDDVRNVGDDAVIVDAADAIKSIDELGESVRSISDANKHLVKTNVLTIDGKELGKVTDLFFDSRSGNVESMEVSQSGLKDISENKKSIKPTDIVTIGADATIVSNYTEIKLDAQGEKGGLKGALNNAKESIQSASETASEKVKDFADTAKDKAEEIGERSKQEAEKAKHVIAKEANNFREDAGEFVDTVKEKSKSASRETERRINELRDEARIRSEDVKDDLRRTSSKVEQKVGELRDEVADKADELATTTRIKTEEAKRESRKLSHQAKNDLEDAAADVRKMTTDIKQTVNAKANAAKSKVINNKDSIKRKVSRG